MWKEYEISLERNLVSLASEHLDKIQKFLIDRDYKTLVISHSPPSPVDFDNYFWIKCSVCSAFINIKIPYSLNKEQDVDYLIHNIEMFGNSHRHNIEQEKPTGLGTIKAYANKLSKGNVTVDLYTYTIAEPSKQPDIYVTCGHCLASRYISMNKGGILSEYLDDIEDFCKKHQEHITIKPPMLLPKKQEEADINLMGELKVFKGGKPINQVNVSQDILKDVYRMSSFNVELQAKVSYGAATDYRAICVKCNETVQLVFHELVYRKNPTWETLSVFCTQHSHTSAVSEIKTGRRFKEVC